MSPIDVVHVTELVSPWILKENPRNAAKHPEDQVLALAAMFKKYGFIGAVVVGTSDVILAGHGRVLAAKKAGMKEIPILRVDHLSQELQDGYVIAENKSSEMKTWNEEMLQSEIDRLCEMDFDMLELGIPTLEDIMGGIEHEERKDGAPSPDDDFETDARRDAELEEESERCEACGQTVNVAA